jgi:hypothetical protein
MNGCNHYYFFAFCTSCYFSIGQGTFLWRGIICKYNARWLHISQLTVSAVCYYFWKTNNVNKTHQLKTRKGAGLWRVMEPHWSRASRDTVTWPTANENQLKARPSCFICPILFERIMIEMDLMQRMTNKTKEKRIFLKTESSGLYYKSFRIVIYYRYDSTIVEPVI